MEQYIGSQEIAMVVELENKKTPFGASMVEVTYASGKKEVMPKKRLESTSSDSLSDDGAVAKMYYSNIASTLFSLLHEYGVKWGEVNPVIDELVGLVDNGYAKASNLLFGAENKSDISLIGINDILLQHATTTKEENNGSASDGGGVDTSDTQSV